MSAIPNAGDGSRRLTRSLESPLGDDDPLEALVEVGARKDADTEAADAWLRRNAQALEKAAPALLAGASRRAEALAGVLREGGRSIAEIEAQIISTPDDADDAVFSGLGDRLLREADLVAGRVLALHELASAVVLARAVAPEIDAALKSALGPAEDAARTLPFSDALAEAIERVAAEIPPERRHSWLRALGGVRLQSGQRARGDEQAPSPATQRDAGSPKATPPGAGARRDPSSGAAAAHRLRERWREVGNRHRLFREDFRRAPSRADDDDAEQEVLVRDLLDQIEVQLPGSGGRVWFSVESARTVNACAPDASAASLEGAELSWTGSDGTTIRGAFREGIARLTGELGSAALLGALPLFRLRFPDGREEELTVVPSADAGPA